MALVIPDMPVTTLTMHSSQCTFLLACRALLLDIISQIRQIGESIEEIEEFLKKEDSFRLMLFP